MLRIQMIGLAIMAALAMSAVAAGSASAATELHQWLLIHDETGIHLLLSAPISVHSEGLVLLEDSGTGTQVHCHGFDAGTVGPHGLDLVESITSTLLGTEKKITCAFDKTGSCKATPAPIAEAIHLPWHTQLVLRGGILRDLILPHGGGKPGWSVTCNTLLGNVTDTCEEEAGKPASTIISNIVGSGVLGEFEGAAGSHAKCSVGGAGAGIVGGTVLTKNPSPKLLLAVSFGP
jgi:hypothetical protein